MKINSNDCNGDSDSDKLHRYDHEAEWKKAVADFTMAIELGDNSAYLDRGSAYASKGEYDKAIADFTMLININPSEPYAYTGDTLS